MRVVLFATAWGPIHGGINSFNQDFACALAAELKCLGKVYCATLSPDEHSVSDAARHNVILIPINRDTKADVFDTSWVFDVIQWLQISPNSPSIDWWIGHDVITGLAALRAPTIAGGSTALIHHMSYMSYHSVKDSGSAGADSKHRSQRELLRSPAKIFSIGPLLRKSCLEIAGQESTQLIPGFPDLPPSRSSDDNLVAITFGRMDRSSDRVKQGRLAVASFGQAIRNAGNYEFKLARLTNPRLYFVGLESDSKSDENEIHQLADKYAGRMTNVMALPYDKDRKNLFNRLGEANLALMLSWHEGFGLTGWEAIAARVPLVITENSGVYHLIQETLHGAGTGCIESVDIQGLRDHANENSFNEHDLKAVSAAIIRISNQIPYYRRNAEQLREMLVQRLGCTWAHTARCFLVGVSDQNPRDDTSNNMYAVDLPTHKADAQHASHDSVFSVDETYNPVAECAELSAGTTQGSTATSFDLLPEVRFGKDEFEVDGLSISYGVYEAALRIELQTCRLVPGRRLGDDQAKHPDIVAKGKLTWEIRGPKEDGILLRRALGSEPLCQVIADSGSLPVVNFELSCRPRHVVYEITDEQSPTVPVTKDRIIQVFLNKCLGADNGRIILSNASL